MNQMTAVYCPKAGGLKGRKQVTCVEDPKGKAMAGTRLTSPLRINTPDGKLGEKKAAPGVRV